MRPRVPRPRVLLTNAEQRAVLAAARGLRADGFLVGATAEDRGAPGLWSRACAEPFSGAPSISDSGATVEFLEGIVATGRYELLLAGTDEALFAISRHRARLEGAVQLGLPGHEVVAEVFDRTLLARAAGRSGLVSAPSVVCSTPEEAVAAGRALGFPVMLKAVHAVLETDAGIERWKSARVDEEGSLEAALERFPRPLIVERHEPGPVVSFAGVLAGGRLLGAVFSRYLRTWPPEAGSAAFSRTDDPPPGLPESVKALLEEMSWEGLFELEMIERPDGVLLPIDLNPRLYGSLALGIRAGANLPAIWARWLLGKRPEPARAAPGVYYRWGDVDLRHRLRTVRDGRLREARAASRPRRPVAGAYLRLGDPVPFVARVLELADVGRRRLGRKTAARRTAAGHVGAGEQMAAD